ncbi:TolC family protein [Francisellaceae bacterium]|nr:TolC family protein [Francisellaceae bacterium]
MGIKKALFSVFSLGLSACIPVSAMDLLETYKAAYKSSPIIKYQYATYQAMNEDSNIALGGLLPNISLSASASATRFFDKDSDFYSLGTIESTTVGATLSQSIFNYPLINIYRSAKQSAQASYATYEYQVQEFILNVAETYFSVILAEANVQVAKEQIKATEATLKQTKAELKVGTKTESDVKQIESSYYNAKATLVKNKNTLKSSYYDLAVLTGIQKIVPLDPIRDDMQALRPSPSSIQQWVDMAVQKNLSLQASKLDQVASETAVEACKGKFFPTVSLSASYTYLRSPFFQPGFSGGGSSSAGATAAIISDDVSASCLVDTSNEISAGSGGQAGIPLKGVNFSMASIGLTFTWSIFNGGTDYAALQQGAEDYVNARYTTLQNQRSIIQQTEKDYLAVLTAISSIKAYRQAKISSDIAYQMMLEEYKVGTLTVNEVLQQMSITYQNAYNVVQAEYDYITTLLSLKLDAGTLSINDVEDVNRFLKHK